MDRQSNPHSSSRNQTFAIAVKKHSKLDTKVFSSCPVLLDFSILFQIFCLGLWYHCTLSCSLFELVCGKMTKTSYIRDIFEHCRCIADFVNSSRRRFVLLEKIFLNCSLADSEQKKLINICKNSGLIMSFCSGIYQHGFLISPVSQFRFQIYYRH